MTEPWNDPRIARGMKAQLTLRKQLLDGGARPIGWKVGFGAPAAMQKLGISAPLVGFLTSATAVQPGTTISVKGWTKPVLEPEIAVHMGRDLAGGADRAKAAAAIAALGPAIELADLNSPPENVEAILSGNIYHRGVIVGPRDNSRAGARLDGLSGVIIRNGTRIEAPPDLQSNIGDLIDIVAHVANLLAACGETLHAGEFIITGSVIPLLFLEPRVEEVAWTLDPIGTIAVCCTPD
jgi:2-keto-4-pentenoate hydratase